MLAFRPALVRDDPRPLTSSLIAEICQEVSAPVHFVISLPLKLQWSEVVEEPFWELFLGGALDDPQTRERQRFQSWHIRLAGCNSTEPLLALRWDRDHEVVHVTRAIQCYVHEGFDS